MTGPRTPLLGSGMGLEHIVILVRDLPQATDDFRQRVGFAISPGGVHASGTVENSVTFGDDSYLELVGIHDPSRDTPQVREAKRFLAVREGPVTIGVRISSAEAAAAQLRRAGLDVTGPTPARIPDPETGELSQPMFWNVEVTGNQPYLKETIFFTEKVEGAWEAYVATNPNAARINQSAVSTHPNTATRIAAAWLAVDDIERAKASYSSVGLVPLAERTLPLLHARVAEVPLGAGSLMLTQSLSSRGPIDELLSRVQEPCAMMGASVEVTSLSTARSHLATHADSHESSTSGWFGKNLVVPTEMAHGVWMEMFEHRGAP